MRALLSSVEHLPAFPVVSRSCNSPNYSATGRLNSIRKVKSVYRDILNIKIWKEHSSYYNLVANIINDLFC